MLARARRRLALRYLALFAIVVAAFSVVFMVILAIVLRPAFDIAPEISNAEAARQAYSRTMEGIGIALLAANAVVVVIMGAAGYYLADRTLRPIRDAHDRQRRFVADASHEMRTPLAAIASTAESALLPDSDVVAKTTALTSIAASTHRMSRLTSDLLLLARTESGLLESEREAVDLSVVVAEEAERLRAAHPDLGSGMALSLASDLVVMAVASDIGRIVANLLDNAVRHGASPIQVRTTAQDGMAVTEVIDAGPGMADADLGRIFEPFYRVRRDADAPAGSGLGLAIAAGLAGQYAGRLAVESQPGHGARFRLELPRFR